MKTGISDSAARPFSDVAPLVAVPPIEQRRRNATRDVTAPLRQWLDEHRKNPYPTYAEKTMLCVITRMTMAQASHHHHTWKEPWKCK